MESDRIVYEKVGAYTMSLTPLFIRRYPRVYIEDNDNLYEANARISELSFLIE